MGQLLDRDPDDSSFVYGKLGCDDKGSDNMTQHATSTAILSFSDILVDHKLVYLIQVQLYQMKGHTSVFES